MDSKIPKEYGSTICNIKTLMKSLFLAKGIDLVAVGIHGLLTYTCPDVECHRLKNRSVLILLFGCFHLISLICCIHWKNAHTNYRVFIAYVLCSCGFSGLILYQSITTYEYLQALSPHFLFAIIMTGIYNLLVFIICCMFLVELCQKKEEVGRFIVELNLAIYE
ncbi:uncharacterized protein LOC132755860 isoform X2 [Ruditapes philippinarum]|nr:uncharacterized protein LOC132755860 isoform X2 [Ruditapes philippinarum]XP_060602776.1 uncharacterized protein LOC132755860 isoform X2 [Ruditapes philippinarum]XP_060602777.1 uncharacterized protein LOC132755860 isoform X2 [Ruditapes philippinarum]